MQLLIVCFLCLFYFSFLPPFVAVTSRKIIWNGHWCWRRLKGSSRQRQPSRCCMLTPIPSYCRTGESLAQSTEQSVYTLPVLSSAEYGVWRACGVCLGWEITWYTWWLLFILVLCYVRYTSFALVRFVVLITEDLKTPKKHSLFSFVTHLSMNSPPPYTHHTHTYKIIISYVIPPKHTHTYLPPPEYHLISAPHSQFFCESTGLRNLLVDQHNYNN